MPGYNGTGPRGAGPQTGGGRGFCSRVTGPLYGYGPRRRRRGRAYGGGYGPETGGPCAGSPFPQEKEALKQQTAALERELGRIRKTIEAWDRSQDAAK